MTRRNLFTSAVGALLAAVGLAAAASARDEGDAFELLNKRLESLTKSANEAGRKIESAANEFRQVTIEQRDIAPEVQADGSYQLVVSGNADPSRVARLVVDEVKKLSHPISEGRGS